MKQQRKYNKPMQTLRRKYNKPTQTLRDQVLGFNLQIDLINFANLKKKEKTIVIQRSAKIQLEINKI